MTAGRALAAASAYSWRDRAACSRADPDLFFPGVGESAEPARKICAHCPVRQACLDYAVGNAISHGVWGGLSERERRILRTRRARVSRRERDRAIAAARAAGYTKQAISRTFGISRTSVSRAVARAARAQERS